MLTWIFGAATALLVVATLLPLSRSSRWWVRGFDFPRLQLVVLSAVVLALQLALRSFDHVAAYAVVGANAACLAWQAWWIWPYTRLHRREVRGCTAPGQPRLRILASNVLMTNRDAAPLLDLVQRERPDVLIAIETDAWWEARLDRLVETMPHVLRCPLDNLYGMHVYSRLPLEDAEIRFLVEDDVPSARATLRLGDGRRARLYCLHPRPPAPGEADGSEERDAELVLVGREAARCPLPTVVAGDLNDVAWSRTTRLFRRVSGLLDPRIGRGMFNTFSARIPVLRWPLDHLFHSDHFTLCRIARLPDIGSDHFPILVELALTPGANADDAGLPMTPEAREEARETLQRAGIAAP